MIADDKSASIIPAVLNVFARQSRRSVPSATIGHQILNSS